MIFYLNGKGQSDPSSTLDDSYSFLLSFIKKELFLQLLIISDFLGFGKGSGKELDKSKRIRQQAFVFS